MKLFFNNQDTIFKEALLEDGKDTELFIASAFFSNSKLITQFIDNRCKIKMIIRLNKGTSATELEKLIPYIDSKKISIRFFSDEHFHPKFYIFGDKSAFIGSSNLTNNGVELNQEMNIQIDDLETINNLKEVFSSYWGQAKELTQVELTRFKEITNEYIDFENENKISTGIKNQIGNVKYRLISDSYNTDEIMYYCDGEGPCRNFDDYITYSFISAGQKREKTNFLFSDEIRRLKKGMYFFAYHRLEKTANGKQIGGYIGFGKVLEDPVPIEQFFIDGKKIYELPLIQPGIKNNYDNEACEWIAKVEWIKTVTRENAYFYSGIFVPRNTVCKLDRKKHKETIDFLFEKFGLL